MPGRATVDLSYHTFTREPTARQVHVDKGCIVDVDAEGRLVGVEIIGSRTLTEMLPAILAKARFPKEDHEPDARFCSAAGPAASRYGLAPLHHPGLQGTSGPQVP